MNARVQWLIDVGTASEIAIDGLVHTAGFDPRGQPPEVVATMEKASGYGAHAVFFEAGRSGGPPIPQALIFVSAGAPDDPHFAKVHKRLWSWGGVPLLYRKTMGLVQLFRCAHKPDFVSADGDIVCNPVKTLSIASLISASDAWWDATRLRNGTLWDDPAVTKQLLSASKGAHKGLINAVRQLNEELNHKGILPKHLRRKLLILSLLIAYLEERGAFPPDYFAQFLPGASRFFSVLADGKALVSLLADLEQRFNGNVFVLNQQDQDSLLNNGQLGRFAKFVEAHEEPGGQLTLWQLYSFKDLPVELISHIYQIFVKDEESSVYTPPFMVRLMLEETLSWERLDRLQKCDEIILDPCCGSGVFLVEAYKRLILHWRSRNQWKRPSIPVLKLLLKKVFGIDHEEGAVELAAFSLCLALCDALEPEEIRASIKLFPPLAGKTVIHSCFFAAKEEGLLKEAIGVVIGNPPFVSSLNTPGAMRSYERYQEKHGVLPDKQLAYLFLHEAMIILSPGGILCLLQQYSFLYNQHSLEFRSKFFSKWDVREVLDFISVRGLFQKGDADTKVVVVLAEAAPPVAGRKILHAVFRRSGRIDAEQGFDIDYYDIHWLPQQLVLDNDGVWRADLLGGGRVLAFVDRLKKCRNLGQYAESQGWDFGEGYIEGRRGVSNPADHIVGKQLLPSEGLTQAGIDRFAITTGRSKAIEGPRSAKRFTPPMLLVREHMDLPHAVWTESYLTYKNKIVGFAAPNDDHLQSLTKVNDWLTNHTSALRAFVAGISVRLFTQKATTLSGADITALPYPESGTLDLSHNEELLVDDIVRYQRDLVRLGNDSEAIKQGGLGVLPGFTEVFTAQINTVYKKTPLKALSPQTWPGIICQAFVFGNGSVDWNGADELRGKIDSLLREQKDETLQVTRIARIYDKRFIFFLKPDRARYWLRSVALRDADETLADLRSQGF